MGRQLHDLVVLGAGVGGLEVALRAAEAHLDVLVIEAGLVGGECPYWGCVPSKAMTRAGQLIGEARRAGELAGAVDIRPNWDVAVPRIKKVSNGWNDTSTVDSLRAAGVQVRRGRGRFLGPDEIEVDGDRISGQKGVVIATGTKPVIPDVDGLPGVRFWTNREAIETPTCPRSLVVLGGGPVGLELGQVFRRFGAEVTIVEAAERILPAEEPENSAALSEMLRADGIMVRTGVGAERVEPSQRGVSITLSDGSGLDVERLLVATGRRPDLKSIHLERAGLDPDSDFVPTDSHLRAGDGLWAVGDVTGHGAFTHVAYYQAQIAAADILGHPHEAADYSAVPRVTFTDPEVGGVGLTEEQARRQGIDVQVGVIPANKSDRAVLYGEGAGAGVVKLVADAGTGTLVGGSSLGPAAGETAAWLALAIRGRVPISLLKQVILPYPTFARALRGALRQLG